MESQKIRTLSITPSGAKLNRLGLIRILPRDAICVCGRNFSFYVNRKCQLSTAEMSLYRVVDMLGNSC